MAYLDVDFSIPIALSIASIVGVVFVRLAVSLGEKRAEDRTRRLIEENGLRGRPRAPCD